MITVFTLAFALAATAPAAAVPLAKSYILLNGGDAVEDTDWAVRPWLTAAELETALALGDPFAIVHCTSLSEGGELAGCRAASWRGSNAVADRLALEAIGRARVAPSQAGQRSGRDLWITTTLRLVGGDSFPRGACPPTWCRLEPPPPPPPTRD